ncbi:hypothetical protein [Candidatus Palauibacter sp.]|uniref:hypothetical protein n=1 Tax=Candidatus Palauibacter sp. TaxID=3101350 RepID=UPI003B0276B8
MRRRCDVNDIIEGLDTRRRRRVEERAAELIAEETALRRSVEAMGGRLSPVARFPDRPPVELSGIADPE